MIKQECQMLGQRFSGLESAKINNEYAVCNKQTKKYFRLFEQTQPQST